MGSNEKLEKTIKVEIGDTVLIRNIITNITEEYTIVPTYHTQKIVGSIVTRNEDFGRGIYKDVLLSNSDIEKGIILSESNLAKKIIGLPIGCTFSFLDDEMKEADYQIVDIQKNINN